MKLYVLGPAFGCASIDPQCNAAVALLAAWAAQKHKRWELVSVADDFERIPRLVDNDKKYIGFCAIADHLRLDGDAKRQVALEAFVESTGQLMIDVYHYVSYENYSDRTRRAFTSFMPWYANYFVPPERRAAARRRTSHLNISSIDADDDVHDSVLDKPPEEMSLAEKKYNNDTEKRASLLLGRPRTLKSLLRQPAHSGAFKLKALSDSFYEPLNDTLGDKEFFSRRKDPDAADCLVFGHLSLLLYPDMVQTWAADVMRKDYPRLAEYTQRMRSRLGLVVSDAEVGGVMDSANLPWTAPDAVTIGGKASTCGNAILRHLPWAVQKPAVAGGRTGSVPKSVLDDLVPHTLLGLAGCLGVAGYAIHAAGLWPRGEAVQFFGRKRLSDYGAAGAALSVLGALS